ncbi:MAG: RtcB family protein [Planctomycetota bacterium]
MIERWTIGPLSDEVERALERLIGHPNIARVAVMPDVHLSQEFCIGTVTASESHIFPRAVGDDIGCGMAAIALDTDADVLADPRRAQGLLRALARLVPPHRHGPDTLPDLPTGLGGEELSDPRLTREVARDGRVQLGTLGRGNHFVELQRAAEGRLWLMVHSGSRAMGQRITQFHVGHSVSGLDSSAAGGDGLGSIEANSPAGRAYLHDVDWARRYARANRQHLVEAVAVALEALFGVSSDEATLIDCDHNHVEWEHHDGRGWWVHRKGALRARDGEPGVIPGSMGSPSYHVTGRGCERALTSSSHGAGRAMSRTEARRNVGLRDFRRELGRVHFDRRIEDALREEAPGCYKDIDAVMRAQRELTRIERRLEPVLVYKAN